MKVYVAGPYTLGDTAINVANAIHTGDKLLEMGHYPYIPHLTHFWHLLSHKPHDVWLDLDLKFLAICDCLLRLPGKSEGANLEVFTAGKLNIPVYYDIKDIKG